MRRPIDLGRVHSAALETAPGPFTGHSGLCNQAAVRGSRPGWRSTIALVRLLRGEEDQPRRVKTGA